MVTTIQEEASASYLVTGTLQLRVTVTVDSSTYLTPDWVTGLLQMTQPGMLPLVEGGTKARVRVPGRVSYGFDVKQLVPSMIRLSDRNVVEVTLPELSIHSVEPDLTKLAIRTTNAGWTRVLPSDVSEEVRSMALSDVEPAFRRQAERRIDSATQPRINTARALERYLRPPLQAAGVPSPEFQIRIGARLIRGPEE